MTSDPHAETAMPVDRSGLGVMSAEDCRYRLGSARVGRLAFMSEGYPLILPVNHRLDHDDVVFRTNAGSKLSAAATEQPVAFEVDGFDADRRAGWSVVVRGICSVVDDPDEVGRFDQLGVYPWADATQRLNWVRVRIDEMTGRRLLSGAQR